ncbi:CBS domain-containing protein [Sinorhizobium medicae]|uniref:Inosine-5-monophosphate dehydrogenase n=1 Tax=Sinorhizobium medicae TaxID=110321 RepID=A0A508WPE3_9HYPH|nr:CBS domain-containing protein [Sinorhizobium medicae]MBO1944809.1 CBS domain-containing protein [Sinorhizobium medicae]MBO1960586.1 CBS domain-containing protein [Sinorhizobium medicae]MDX0436423.1 CBS domain-containing protein [Sinorhizobium medicae]MDX0445423.1 CBS domain-containing protein [Sinorhizobium medicae]MDX0463538.1 CBS domain-containing protein [Sinorhizobium medicae]
MSVQGILKEKGCAVITAPPKATVADACRLLHDSHIGAIVVVDEQNVIKGIFTERDVVSVIARSGARGLAADLQQVMWKNVHCCTNETSINDLMEAMNRHKARHLPVKANGQLAGIVSIGDVVRHHIRAIECEAEYIRSYIAG